MHESTNVILGFPREGNKHGNALSKQTIVFWIHKDKTFDTSTFGRLVNCFYILTKEVHLRNHPIHPYKFSWWIITSKHTGNVLNITFTDVFMWTSGFTGDKVDQ